MDSDPELENNWLILNFKSFRPKTNPILFLSPTA